MRGSSTAFKSWTGAVIHRKPGGTWMVTVPSSAFTSGCRFSWKWSYGTKAGTSAPCVLLLFFWRVWGRVQLSPEERGRPTKAQHGFNLFYEIILCFTTPHCCVDNSDPRNIIGWSDNELKKDEQDWNNSINLSRLVLKGRFPKKHESTV